MLDKEQLLNIAKPLVKHCVDKYLEGESISLVCLLAGIEPFILEAYRGAGHNQYLALHAIYDYQKERNDVDFEKMVNIAFSEYRKYSCNVSWLSNLFNCIDSEIELEREKISPFNLITDEFIEDTKKHFLKYKEKIMKDNKNFNFDAWQENLFNRMEENRASKKVK